MKKITIKLLVFVIVLQRLLHLKLQIITSKKKCKESKHNNCKPCLLSFLGVMQVFPNIIARLRCSFYVNFLTENLKLSFIHNCLSFSNIFVIFKGHENTAHSRMILVFLKVVYLMFQQKDFS